MTYFYARVSTKEQNLDRQIEVANKFVVDRFYADKESGKNFERTEYQKMKSELVKGDVVIVKELDRLGRDKQLVKKEIEWYKDNGIILRIVDMPTTMIDYGEQAWVGDMITNILIEVLSSMADQERKKILKRQREGLDAMPMVNGKRVSAKTGGNFGVAPTPCPEFDNYYQRVKAGELGVNQAIKELHIGVSKWYRLCEYKERSISYEC